MLLAAGVLLAGCSAQGADTRTSRQSGSPPAGASPSASGAATESSGSSAGWSVFTPDPSLVPESSTDGARLAESVVLGPDDWGRGFVARSPAVSTPGTWAVLEKSCRWQREKLPRGVLASTSRYSRLPAGSGKSEVKVTAVATVHASVLGADEQLSTTLEEVLRCPEQRPRSNERITGLASLGTAFGAREQVYADDSVLEVGKFVQGRGAAQQYLWMVARLGTVVVAVSVTGGAGHTPAELRQLGSEALAQMLTRTQQRLEGK